MKYLPFLVILVLSCNPDNTSDCTKCEYLVGKKMWDGRERSTLQNSSNSYSDTYRFNEDGTIDLWRIFIDPSDDITYLGIGTWEWVEGEGCDFRVSEPIDYDIYQIFNIEWNQFTESWGRARNVDIECDHFWALYDNKNKRYELSE